MKLNLEQNKAVTHVDGPLLIIAGAGTGKTRVISSRISNLIKVEKISPSSVLALTFTEKAANEMVERVDDEMPLGYEELCIKTFHAFSDMLLREAGVEIGLDASFKIITQVDQWFFFKKHLFDFELDFYRPLGNPNRFIYSILTHFSRLKDELITPEAFLAHAESLDGEERDKTVEIAKTYKKYQDLMIENNLLDFGDLTYYALELLNKRKSVLEEYQNRFKYIMVDEFQDTNYAQFQLVLKLASAHKNIVVVGDDDQSIYKWRGASLSNILQFEEKFPACKKVVLKENYRSSQNILDSAYELITNNNPDRLEVKDGIDKRLNSNIADDGQVEVHSFPNFMQESSFVAHKIKALNENGVPFSEMAVLLRANKLAHPFIDEFKYLGIPYQVRNPKGLLALEEIKDLVALLKTLANPYDDIALLRVLKMDVFAIPMERILKVLNKAKKDSLFNSITATEDENMTIPGTEDPFQMVAALLRSLIEFSKKRPVGLITAEFLRESGYLKYLLDNDKFEEVDNINQFAKHVASFEKDNVDLSVRDFVAYLNLLEEASMPLAMSSSTNKDAVQVLTAHGSKGLEFDHVFIVNAVKNRFPTTNRRDTFNIPESLTKEIYPEGDFHIQEERRLFYVSMTRARKHLYISYSMQYEGNKAWKPSPFITEIVDKPAVLLTEHEESEDALKKLQEFKEPNKAIFELPKFNKARLSYSQFDAFSTCPLKYNYRYLLNVPSPPSHAANFGSSVHNTLNDFYSLLKKGKKPDFEKMTELYEKNWIPYGYDSWTHENTKKKRGLEIMKNFYEYNADPWVIPAYLERPFNIKVGDYWISGRIDRIDKLSDGTYEVIDYKTGKTRTVNDLKKDLQLSIYALACKNVFNIPVSKLTLYFLADNERVSTERSDDSLSELPGLLEQKILEMDESAFSANPGFHCSYCEFKLLCPAV